MATSDRKKPLRVMVDSNILISGCSYPRWPHEVLRHAMHGDFKLVLCPLIIAETTALLRRRATQSLGRLDVFLARCRYESVADPSSDQVRQHAHLVRDITDVPIALAAIQAGVDCLVSEDKDLSARDDTTGRLRELLCVRISGTFLREMMGWEPEDLDQVRKRTWRELDTVAPWE